MDCRVSDRQFRGLGVRGLGFKVSGLGGFRGLRFRGLGFKLLKGADMGDYKGDSYRAY